MSEILARLIEQPVGPAFDFGGYRVARSSTNSEDQAAFAFRHRIYSKAGFLASNAFPGGALSDDFDRTAVQILVRDSLGNMVGAARFVRHSTMGFHTENLFDFDLPPVNREQLGEFGRLAIEETHRGGNRVVMVAILKGVFECMIESGTTHVLAFLSPRLADSFSDLGCKPMAIRMKNLSAASLENRRAMQPYFESQSATPVLYDLETMLLDVGVRRNQLGVQLERLNVKGVDRTRNHSCENLDRKEQPEMAGQESIFS